MVKYCGFRLCLGLNFRPVHYSTVYPSIYLSNNVAGLLRRVEHQSVPLALDVVVLRLLSDIDTVKLQLSGQLLLSLEDNQRNLKGREGKEDKLLDTYERTQKPT